MKIALIQLKAGPEPQANRDRGLSAARDAAVDGAEVIVFPELAFTRFFPQVRAQSRPMHLAETVPGPTTDAFSALAKELGVVIVLNLYERSGDRTYDSSPVIDADGTLLGVTRMVHITQYDGFFEQDYYDPGDTGAPVYQTRAGRIGVAICYDRHYPEYMRALGEQEPDLVVIPQAGVKDEWPAGVFEAEVQAAAFQNGYYAALANRVGSEEVLEFDGGSFVVDPYGQVITRAPRGEESTLTCSIDPDMVLGSPARTLFFKHRRDLDYRSLRSG